MDKISTDQIYLTLKSLACMEIAFLDYSNRMQSDFKSFQIYQDFFNNSLLRESESYKYYFPAAMTTSSLKLKTIQEFGQIKAAENIMPGYDFSICKQFNFPEGPLHNCDYFTFVSMLEGTGRLIFTERILEMNQGDFFLIPPNVEYGLEPKTGALCLCMNLRYSFISANYQSIFHNDPRLTKFVSHALFHTEQNMYAAFHTTPSPEIKELLMKMFAEYLTLDKFSCQIMRHTLMILTASILRSPDTKWMCSTEDPYKEDHLYQIYQFIQQNYQTATLSGLAESIHFSKQYICRLIRQQTGTTFSSLLNQVRMDTACLFLSESNLSVTEIAYLCGFSESSNMTRQFKKQFGVSPSAYRKKITNS